MSLVDMSKANSLADSFILMTQHLATKKPTVDLSKWARIFPDWLIQKRVINPCNLDSGIGTR